MRNQEPTGNLKEITSIDQRGNQVPNHIKHEIGFESEVTGVKSPSLSNLSPHGLGLDVYEDKQALL